MIIGGQIPATAFGVGGVGAHIGGPAANQTAAQGVPSPSTTDPAAVAGVPLSKLHALARQRAYVAFVNRDYQAVKAEVDRTRGVVHFSRPVGHLVDLQIRSAPAEGQLLYPPRVRITFAYRDNCRAREALAAMGVQGAGLGLPEPSRGQGEAQYNYSYLAGRGAGDGEVKHLNPDLVDSPDAKDLFPIVIRDDSFKMFVRFDGSSNKAELDAKAAEIAKQILKGENEVDGEDGTAFGFYEIVPSSKITSVKYEGSPGVVKTEWSIGKAGAAKNKAAIVAVSRASAAIVDRFVPNAAPLFGAPSAE